MFNKLLKNFDSEHREHMVNGFKGVGSTILTIYLSIILFWVTKFIKFGLIKGLLIATGVFLILFAIVALIYGIIQFMIGFDCDDF